MKLVPNQLYHIYNQGNNQESIFLEREDYINFLRKVREHIATQGNILAYCLMPNHFHFLMNVTEQSVKTFQLGGIKINQLTNGFRKLLYEYAQAFNLKYHRTGSLFRQKTKGKCLNNDKSENYPFICFHYIHQNPMKAKLVKKMEDWEFSSFKDYANFRQGTLCNQELAYNLIDISKDYFYNESYQVIDDDKTLGLYV